MNEEIIKSFKHEIPTKLIIVDKELIEILLDKIESEERAELVSKYCRFCGDKDGCYCDPGYDI